MARILCGIGVSHSPTIGLAHGRHKQQRPGALRYIFNDHATSFFFDYYAVETG
jgi:gallate dioxygenase